MREANYVVPNPYYVTFLHAGFGETAGSPGKLRLKGAYGEWLMVVPEDVPCMWEVDAPEGLKGVEALLFSWDGRGAPELSGTVDFLKRPPSGKLRIDDVCPVTFRLVPGVKTALLRGGRGKLTLDMDMGYDRWDGRTWRVDVPEGLFLPMRSPNVACVRWREDGTPELVPEMSIYRTPYLGIGVDPENPPKYLYLKGGRKDRCLFALLESEWREGEEGFWKIEVPGGYFDRNAVTGEAFLSWPEGGSPSLVDSFADDLPYLVALPRRSADPFARAFALPPGVRGRIPEKTYARGSLESAELSCVEGEGFVPVELPEGVTLGSCCDWFRNELALSWPEGWTPLAVRMDSLYGKIGADAARFADLGFHDWDLGWGGRPLFGEPEVFSREWLDYYLED